MEISSIEEKGVQVQDGLDNWFEPFKKYENLTGMDRKRVQTLFPDFPWENELPVEMDDRMKFGSFSRASEVKKENRARVEKIRNPWEEE